MAPLLFAIVSLSLLVGFPPAYDKLARVRNWRALPLPHVPLSEYSNLTATVAQAAAAMLALFFAAISLVASTTYAKVTTEIRSLIAHDDLNWRYMRLLAHLAATATGGLALQALGIPPSSLLAIYIILLSGVALLAFIPLGVRTFALFDPSNLTTYPSRAFVRALRLVTSTGHHWLDPSFQNHANSVAESQLRMFDDLVVFAITEDRPRHGAVLETARAVSRLARYYVAKKVAIPSDSLWFTRKAEFKRWDVSSSSITGLSLHTGVALSPESAPDHSFVESACTHILTRCLKSLVDRDALDDVVALLLEVNATATYYCRFFSQRDALQLARAVRIILVEKLKSSDAEVEPLKQLEVIDVYCVAALAPILTISIAIAERPLDQIFATEKALLLLDRRRLYQSSHPRSVLQDMEDLLRRLEFEKEVEGKLATQSWYVRQIIAHSYAAEIRDIVSVITLTLDDEFVVPSADLLEARRYTFAALWLQRGIEACHKATDRIGTLKARYEELAEAHKTEASWLPLNSEEALARIEKGRVRIVKLLAQVVPGLCTVPVTNTLPDFLGQARAWIADELVAMMDRKEAQGFPELFQAYFNASLVVQRHFFEISKEPGKQDYARVAVDAILDVMEISGLALLFSEVDGTRCGPLVARAWDVYFESIPDKAAFIRGLYSAVEMKLSLPWLSPSAMQRQQWGQRFVTALMARGVVGAERFGLSRGRRREEPHHSAVIESVSVHYGHTMDHPHEYFAALYLAKRKEAAGIEVPHAVAECIESIERAEARQKEYTE